jgi:hypothetical protein
MIKNVFNGPLINEFREKMPPSTRKIMANDITWV